jgi:hypothetical protein
VYGVYGVCEGVHVCHFVHTYTLGGTLPTTVDHSSLTLNQSKSRDSGEAEEAEEKARRDGLSYCLTRRQSGV